jgi:putative phosphonate catabolism associated alcohol dehydrogenase
MKSKVAIFTKANQPIGISTVNIPILDKGQILVKNEYVTLCKSDINTFCGKRIERTPTILGHEIVGRIVAFGENASQKDERGNALHVGDRITWAIFASNPQSELSKNGIPQKAPDLFKYGHEMISLESHLHGGLAEYIILRANTPIIKIEESIPLPVAALVNCSVATVAGALRLAGNINNKKVLISGIGMLGVIACAMCHTLGAASVFALDIDRHRLDTALHFGANHSNPIDNKLLDQIKQVYGSSAPFDVVLELSGQPSSMELTLDLLNIGGVAVWVGATYPARDTQINAEKLIRNILTIKGLHNYNREDFISAVNFIENQYQNFPFNALIDDHYSLDDVNDAFQEAIKMNPFRVGIRL